MSTLTAHHGFGRGPLRALLHVPRFAPTPTAPAPSTRTTSWLQRLADWAERQPMHHRLGSYTALR